MSGPGRRYDLAGIAARVMMERGLEPEFPAAALAEAAAADVPPPSGEIRDLRALAWASIDNDDSRDLDQLSVAEPLPNGAARVLVAIADVDALAPRGSAIDAHARLNTTSVYTAARIFAMLPERLSTDLTSLIADEDRLAVVIAYVVQPDGTVTEGEVYRALVRNKAKLAYDAVAAWLDGTGPAPEALSAAAGVPDQIRLQDELAARLNGRRHDDGALDLQTIEAQAVMKDGQVQDLKTTVKNRARTLIEDFMIAANGVTARFLKARGIASLRRVVRSPERWDRLEELAKGLGDTLPADPDAGALAAFLKRRRAADPLRFPDLSLTVVKLMGAGEYVVERPGEEAMGHFGLAVRDYVHSTAPNRRYPDLLTQRMLKATLAGAPTPYAAEELDALARHCTQQEDAANKVERQVRKSAAAMLMQTRIGQRFDALVTGAGPKGTWVRTLQVPVEGRLERGAGGLDVGDRVQVTLLSVDVERGYIDFGRSGA